MDWASRQVLSWRLSNTMDSHFCIDALEVALGDSTPEIFNTDQGAQFTNTAFTDLVQAAGARCLSKTINYHSESGPNSGGRSGWVSSNLERL